MATRKKPAVEICEDLTDKKAKDSNNESCIDEKLIEGDLVYIQGGAVDTKGRPISAIYAGSDKPLTVRNISNGVCVVFKDEFLIGNLDQKYISKVPYKK